MNVDVLTDAAGTVRGVYTKPKKALAAKEQLTRSEGDIFTITQCYLNEDKDDEPQDEG